jgi:hypothetical protein
MDEQTIPNSLDKIYAEAGQWVRLCNTVVWSMGAILIPLSIGCIGLAQQYPPRSRFFAGASLLLYAVWVYVSRLYRNTAAEARQVLMNIEQTWEVPKRMALYEVHGQVGHTWYSLFNVQIVGLVLLMILWAFLLLVAL